MAPLCIQWETDLPPLPPRSLTSLEKNFATLLRVAGFPQKSVNLLFAEKSRMQSLNLEYRGKDRPTDILSFEYGLKEDLIGDLAICVEVAKAQARENGWDIETECLRLLTHGLAHLMGMDHQKAEAEKEMLRLELRLLEAVGLKTIYPPQKAGGK